MDREDLDFVLDVTKFKTKDAWGEDPWKPVPGPAKAALTRALHAKGHRPRCNIAVEEFKKGRKGKRGAPPASPDAEGIATGATCSTPCVGSIMASPLQPCVSLSALRHCRGGVPKKAQEQRGAPPASPDAEGIATGAPVLRSLFRQHRASLFRQQHGTPLQAK